MQDHQEDMRPCLLFVSILSSLAVVFTKRTFYGIPPLIIFVRGCIARWPASESLHDQRVQIDHRKMVLEHILHALSRHTRRQRRYSRKCGRSRHLENGYCRFTNLLVHGRMLIAHSREDAEAGKVQNSFEEQSREKAVDILCFATLRESSRMC